MDEDCGVMGIRPHRKRESIRGDCYELVLQFSILEYSNFVSSLGVTQSAVRKTLADEEAAQLRKQDAVIVHEDISRSMLINAGLDLEDRQYVGNMHCSKITNVSS